jgi:hypothetical protein
MKSIKQTGYSFPCFMIGAIFLHFFQNDNILIGTEKYINIILLISIKQRQNQKPFHTWCCKSKQFRKFI